MFTYMSYANLPYWNVLPMGMMRFSSGDIAVFNCESQFTPPALMFNPLAQSQLYSTSTAFGGMSIPSLDIQATCNNIFTNTLNYYHAQRAQQMANSLGSVINSTIGSLNVCMSSADYTDEEKAKVKEFIDKIDKQKEIYENILKNTSISNEERCNQLKNVETELNNISAESGKYVGELQAEKDKAKKAADEAKAKADAEKAKAEADAKAKAEEESKAEESKSGESQQQQEELEETNNTNDKTKTGDSSKSNSSGSSEKTDGGDKTEELSEEEQEQALKDLKKEALNVIRSKAADFANAVNGPGTGDAFEEVLDFVEANPADDYVMYGEYIVNLANQWDKNQKAAMGVSFIEAFMDDASHLQKKNYGEKMVRGLRGLARKYKCEDKVKTDLDYIDKELKSLIFIKDGPTIAAFNRVYEVIKEKMKPE